MNNGVAPADRPIAVVGSGLMGTGIAVQFARAGYAVICYDPDLARLETSGTAARALLGERITSITYSSTLNSIAAASLVIEAAPENIELKKHTYAAVEDIIATDVIIASNSSGFLPDALSAQMRDASRFLIAHFWNPPYAIPLVELVPGVATRNACVKQLEAMLESVGMEPVILSKALPGLIGNRLQFALLREALHLLRSGVASAATIDKVMTASLGRRYATIGPLASADRGGLDTILTIADYLMPQLAKEEQGLLLLREKVARGDLGCKTGQGFYVWGEEY